MLKKLMMNAETAQDQEEYRKRYDGYAAKHEKLWNATVDHVTVNRDGSLVFTMRDVREIRIKRLLQRPCFWSIFIDSSSLTNIDNITI